MGWDVLVVGGGIAGVSVAAELAPHRSVLLVEAEPELARHTTGRSAAVYLPSYGGPVVRALTAASRDAFGDGVLTPRPMLWLGSAEEVAAAPSVEVVDAATALELCPVLRPDRVEAFAVDAATMDIDVMGLHQRYVRTLREHGAIRLAAPVTALRRDGAGWRVSLGGEEIQVGYVVNAAGAWADRLAALAGVPGIGLRPLRRTIAIAVGAGRVDPRWPLVADIADTFYFRPEGPGVLVSPADETPAEPGDAKPDELDIALAVDRVNEVSTLGLRSVRTAWAGLRSFAADRDPVVGEVPGHPGFAFVAGQGGYGIQMAPALASTAAAIIRGEPTAVPAAALSPARFATEG
ncbi:FAD-dependent oxidoreductase [Actinokineospora sp. NBRC 105648]|uniref:NAD(P)/FAD-dependent oxidoreductase n=1 Tax=Actinokineospora sp. NBRC 105648 TaxID=3032206 RepID=UPI0024A36568|nr:FAD-dependent oxidoreductase [Actinokineospora sp. NBRC 105648]GLZ39558.1 glycerol-3-phosphate dehydrogenase [Actinokineospora sp. NBRC 105648]